MPEENTVRDILIDLSQSDPDRCIRMIEDLTIEDPALEMHYLIRFSMGFACLNKAASIGKELMPDQSSTPSMLDYIEIGLTNLRVATELNPELDFNKDVGIDIAATILEQAKPGSVSLLWGKIKLKYFGNRVWLNTQIVREDTLPTKDDVKPFVDVPFASSSGIRSILALSVPYDDQGRKFLHLALYESMKPWDESGKPGTPTEMIKLYHDDIYIQSSNRKSVIQNEEQKKGIRLEKRHDILSSSIGQENTEKTSIGKGKIGCFIQRVNLRKISKTAVGVVLVTSVVLAIWSQFFNSEKKMKKSVPPLLATSAVPTPKSKQALKVQENRMEFIKKEIDEIGTLIEKGDYDQADKRLSKLNKQYPDFTKEAIDNVHMKLSVEYRVTLDQKLNKAIDKDSFLLEGIVTEKQPQEGSGAFWGFNFKANDGIEHAFACSASNPLRYQLDGVNIDQFTGYKKLKDAYANVRLIIPKNQYDYVMNKCKNKGCDNPICPSVIMMFSPSPTQSVATVPAQDPPSTGKMVDAPTIMVGDSYTYETENISNSKLSYVATREVTAIEGNRLSVVTTNTKSGSKRINYYDRTWGYLGSGASDNDGVSFSPALKYLDFPLSVGKKWTAQSTETDKKTGRQRQHTINGMVDGWEKVQVPAGEYEALKIILKTEVKDADKVSPGTDISWYVPALRRSVKSELTGLDVSTGHEEKRIARLLTYHLTSIPKSSSSDTANKSQEDTETDVPPKLPFVKSPACPFEGCRFGKWKLTKPVKLYSAPDINSSVISELKINDDVEASTGQVITSQYGQVKVMKGVKITSDKGDFFLKPGDFLYEMLYLGEGMCIVFYKGNTIEISEGWNSETGSVADQNRWGQLVQKRLSDWWVKVYVPKNKMNGWIVNPKADGMDMFG
ncbi:MAG: hypothetical protein WCR46_11715 [Deltaproteobacteria bacterium]